MYNPREQTTALLGTQPNAFGNRYKNQSTNTPAPTGQQQPPYRGPPLGSMPLGRPQGAPTMNTVQNAAPAHQPPSSLIPQQNPMQLVSPQNAAHSTNQPQLPVQHSFQPQSTAPQVILYTFEVTLPLHSSHSNINNSNYSLKPNHM
jgi:hypothetical protein